MIFIRDHCLFVHVQKTGGSSVAAALHGWSGVDVDPNKVHLPARDAKQVRGYRGEFCFGFARNPFDRMVSWWAWERGLGVIPEDREFTEWCRGFRYLDMWPMLEGCDYVGRFESLCDDFEYACIQSAIEPIPELQKVNASEHDHWREYYDEELFREVRDRVYKDLLVFGYTNVRL